MPPVSPANALDSIPKVVSPTVHGIIDYSHAAFFFTVGLLCSRSNKPASRAAFATSGFILVQSLLTDYPLGVKPVFSFETHGKMDAIMAASSWMIPLVLGFAGTGAAKVFESNSLIEGSIVATTDWNSQRAHQKPLSAALPT